MDETAKRALLPAGLGDLLPPDGDREELLTRRLVDCFRSFGYERVKPPMVEFEDSLLDGVGAIVTEQTFRLMDPISQRMMGLRADITPQIARIAATRLKSAPRPLRLSYAGEVMRVKGDQLQPERQFRQVGVELIGAAKAAMGDAEVILLAARALGSIDIAPLSVDINAPTLAASVCTELAVPDHQRDALLAALDRKDAAALAGIDSPAAEKLGQLLATVGPAATATTALARIKLPGESAALAQRLIEVVELVTDFAPTLGLTVDPVESRGFAYHTGISFTLLAPGYRNELGSGGRYLTADGEPATGFTLFMHNLQRASPVTMLTKRIFLPLGTDGATRQQLCGDGWTTVMGLVAASDDIAEAARLRCSHVWQDGVIVPVNDT